MQDGIVFFGSGPVAAKSLEGLHKHFSVEAVVTKPKPAHHRGSFPVIDTAQKLKLPVQTVTDKSELSNLFKSKPFESKIGVLIDFGIIVTKNVIDYFPLGIVNSHFSVLPEWRGADPITFALLSGQSTTGVSLMLIDEGMDTGKILRTKKIQIQPEDTSLSLTDKLIALSDDMLAETLPAYVKGEIKPRRQPHPQRATYSRKLTKEDGVLDWNKSATVLEREIRAFYEWPKSRATFGGKEVIITQAHTGPILSDSKPGDIVIIDNDLGVTTADSILWIDHLKPAGKKEMPAKAFLAGYRHLL